MAYGIFLGSLRNRSGHSGHPGANISSSLSVERTDCAEYSIFKVLKYFLLYTVSVRRATVKSGRVIGPSKFLSTPSVRRATASDNILASAREFLSTPSVRRATWQKREPVMVFKFLSTPSVRRATIL